MLWLWTMFCIRIHWFQIRIRIQHFRLNNNPNPDPGFWWKNKNKTAEKIKLFFDQKLQFRMSKLQNKPSALKREHPALQKIKFLIFFCFFLLVIFLKIFFGGFIYFFPRTFYPPRSGSGSGFRIRIRIQWSDWIRIRSKTLAVTANTM